MSAGAADVVLALVQGAEDAINRRDADALFGLLADDCLVELRSAGDRVRGRWEGSAAFRAAWAGWAAALPGGIVEAEDVFACGTRCAYRWVLRWHPPGGRPARVRGMTLFTLQAGKVCRAVSYVVD
jgi:ketosteroid isomerase-like protein